MILVGFWLGVAAGLLLSLFLDDLAALFRQEIRRQAVLAVLAQQAEGEKK